MRYKDETTVSLFHERPISKYGSLPLKHSEFSKLGLYEFASYLRISGRFRLAF
jgi:hypothetical protein